MKKRFCLDCQRENDRKLMGDFNASGIIRPPCPECVRINKVKPPKVMTGLQGAGIRD